MKRGNLSNLQKGVIHQAATKLGLIRHGDDEQYRLVLRNICNVESSTEMDQRDYDKLISFFRNQGMSIGRGEPDLSRISSRQLYAINQLMARLPGVNLAGVIRQIFGMAVDLKDLKRFEAPLVISALQNILQRQSRREAT